MSVICLIIYHIIYVTYQKYSLTKPLITDDLTSTGKIGSTVYRDKIKNTILMHGGTGCDGLSRLDKLSYWVTGVFLAVKSDIFSHVRITL